jgi:hypothetical protein
MPGPKRQSNICWQSLTALILLGVLVSGGFGIPFVPVVYKSKTVPFPCQDCACACHSADVCWRGCCCMTDGEKVAWAAQRGVQVPRFLLDRVRRQLAAATFDAASLHKEGSSCGGRCGSQPPIESAGPEAASQLHIVLLTAQSKCQGVVQWLNLFSIALVQPATAAWTPEQGLGLPLAGLESLYLCPPLQPPEPPPRII